LKYVDFTSYQSIYIFDGYDDNDDDLLFCLIAPAVKNSGGEQFLNGTSAQYQLCSTMLSKLQKIRIYNRFKNDESNNENSRGKTNLKAQLDSRQQWCYCKTQNFCAPIILAFRAMKLFLRP